jgi:hypothetical protein
MSKRSWKDKKNVLDFGIHIFSECISCDFASITGLDFHLLLQIQTYCGQSYSAVQIL